jgi:hypothetical protein
MNTRLDVDRFCRREAEGGYGPGKQAADSQDAGPGGVGEQAGRLWVVCGGVRMATLETVTRSRRPRRKSRNSRSSDRHQSSKIERCRHASRGSPAPAAWVGSWLEYRSTVSAVKGTAGMIDPSALASATWSNRSSYSTASNRDDRQNVGGEGEWTPGHRSRPTAPVQSFRHFPTTPQPVHQLAHHFVIDLADKQLNANTSYITTCAGTNRDRSWGVFRMRPSTPSHRKYRSSQTYWLSLFLQ